MTTWQTAYLIGSGALNVVAMLALAAVAITAVRDLSKATQPRPMPHRVSLPRRHEPPHRQRPPAFRPGPPPGEQSTQVMQVRQPSAPTPDASHRYNRSAT